MHSKNGFWRTFSVKLLKAKKVLKKVKKGVDKREKI